MTCEFIERLGSVVECHADAPALVEDGAVTTYGELWTRARRVADTLAEAGSVIGLQIEKSTDYVIAMIGVWGAGRAFLPVDPALPEARRRFMLRDACVRDVLTRHGLSEASDSGGAQGDLAYLIYTSGSTGRPKGVAVTHAGVVNLLDAQIAAFELDAGSRALLYLSTSFDAAISDIGTTLLSGAALHIETDLAELGPAQLPERIDARAITHADLPPSLLGSLDPERCPGSLRTIVIGGEVCPPDVVRRWAQRVRLVNVYGPTEATVCSSLVVCASDWHRPLLGQPLPNVEFRVVDGELWIGGVGVARGYVNREELTASKFVERDGQRWFRTGDRVIDRDGDYEFAGRLDRQLKVRGALVAPEEVEARLLEHAAVSRCVVFGRGDPVVLHAVVEVRRDVRVAELVAFAEAALARWMVPRRWRLVESLPETVSGKVDHAALFGARAVTRPETPEQAELAAACETILGHPIGVDEDFFEVGGDSLAAVELAAAAERRGLSLTPARVFAARTVRAMLGETAAAGSAGDLRADVEPLVVRSSRSGGGDGAVLLTGATGQLGSRVLRELERSGAEIHCLVRAEHDVAARERIGEHSAAVTAVAGDVSLPRFGLGAGRWADLTDRVGAVFHCAARVHLLEPYSMLRPTNVGGVAEILRFAAAGRPKHLHYASTLSVLVSSDRNVGRLRESDDLAAVQRVYGGYAQSKFAAETLVRRSRVGPVAVCRFGLLAGASEWFELVVRGIAALGAVPAACDLAFDLTDLDFAAAAMARLPAELPAATYHVANPRSVTVGELVAAIERRGIEVARLSEAEWRARLAQRRGSAPAFFAMCRVGPDFERHRSLDLFQATGVGFDVTNAARALGRECPPPDVDSAVARALG